MSPEENLRNYLRDRDASNERYASQIEEIKGVACSESIKNEYVRSRAGFISGYMTAVRFMRKGFNDLMIGGVNEKGKS